MNDGALPAAQVANPYRVHLADAQRVLSLFAQGLSGRYLHLKPTDALTGNFRPDGITMDGAAVYLPNAVALFDSTRHNLGVYKIAVLHQLGFFECGTFDFSFAHARALIANLPADRTHPSDRALDLERFFALWEAPTLMRRLFMMLEDMRIDLSLRRRYPGAQADLQRVLAHALLHRPDILLLGPFAALLEGLVQYSLGADRGRLIDADGTGLMIHVLDALVPIEADAATVYDSAAAAVLCYQILERVGLPRRMQGASLRDNADGLPGGRDSGLADDSLAALDEDAMDAAPVSFRGEIQPDMVQRQMRSESLVALLDGLDGLDVLDEDDLTADALDRFLREHGQEDARAFDQLALPPDLKPPVSNGPTQEISAAGASTEQAGMLANLQAQSLLRDEQRKRAADKRDQLKRHLDMDRAVLRRAFGDIDGAPRSFLYDEWDFHSQAYIKGWCRLYEHRLKGDDQDFIRGVREKYAVLAHQVKRQFKFIKPESLQRVRRVSDGDELDLDGIIEAVIDRRAGHATDEHVYVRRQKAAREVAAAFLLDMSASTDDPIPDPNAPPSAPVVEEKEDDQFLYGLWNKQNGPPEPPKRRVIDVAKESLALMCEALETLGDGYAVYGFSGYGHDEVEFYVAKEFEDKLNSRTWAAMGAMKPRRSTRMGPAIRHALTKLDRQAVRMKVLIIVSDGFPQDYDYGPDRTDHEYGIQDTARALQEAERKGVQTFCVTIDQSGNDYLRRMCPDNRYLIIDEVAALPSELSKVYRALTV